MTNKTFFRVCNFYIQVKRLDLFVIMETHSDPSKCKHTFSRLGYYGFAFSKARGFASGIAMGWKYENL